MGNLAVTGMGNRPVSLKKLEGFAWGIFFIWLGIVLLTHLSLGVSLLGIGGLILVSQIVRKQLDLNFASFWVTVGILFVLGGIWLLLDIRIALIPIVSIFVGIVLFVSALVSKSTTHP
jgi:hypothetical protein